MILDKRKFWDCNYENRCVDLSPPPFTLVLIGLNSVGLLHYKNNVQQLKRIIDLTVRGFVQMKIISQSNIQSKLHVFMKIINKLDK